MSGDETTEKEHLSSVKRCYCLGSNCCCVGWVVLRHLLKTHHVDGWQVICDNKGQTAKERELVYTMRLADHSRRSAKNTCPPSLARDEREAQMVKPGYHMSFQGTHLSGHTVASGFYVTFRLPIKNIFSFM